MGTVYLAEDTKLNREVAIKVLSTPELNSGLARRMAREAQIVARLEHPGIVPVHDVGVLEDGRVFYAMKFVRGSRLDEYAVRADSIKDCLRKSQSVCDAVAFAHAHGVVHRDLKPQNIMIGSFGEVLVLDWGVAKLLPATRSGAETETLPDRKPAPANPPEPDDDTAHGTIIGTPLYMSPEQARGEISQLDERADIFSLGAILYFLLTKQSPIIRKGSGVDDRPMAADSVLRPREINPKASKAGEAICLKAMASSPDQRYSTAAQLSDDIEKLLDGEPVSAYRENVFERLVRWLGKNRFLVFLVLAYLLMRMFFILTSRR
jgi:serine/threonine protein kinase